MAIMGDKMDEAHFKPSLEDCENEKFGKYALYKIAGYGFIIFKHRKVVGDKI